MITQLKTKRKKQLISILTILITLVLLSTKSIQAQIVSQARLLGVSEEFYENIVAPYKNKDKIYAEFIESAHKGTYKDIGRSQARFLLSVFPDYKKSHIDKLLRFAVKNPPPVEQTKEMFQKHFPELLEEMEGFAEIMQMDTDTVIRYFSLQGFRLGGGCTGVVVGKDKSENGHLMVARNHDWIPSFTDLAVVQTSPNGAYRSIGSSEAVFGRLDGINEHGVFTAMMSSFSKKTDRLGFYHTIIQRKILDKAKNLDEAIQILKEMPISIGYNFILADQSGRAVIVEKIPKANISIRRLKDSKNGLLVSTNHYQSKDKKGKNSFILPNSYERNKKVGRLLNKPKISSQDLLNLLTGSLASGVYMQDYENIFGTLFSSVYDIQLKSWQLKVGNINRNYNLNDKPVKNKITKVYFQNAKPNLLDYASLSELGLIDINSFYFSSNTYFLSGPVMGFGTEIGYNYKWGLFNTEKTYGPHLNTGVYTFISPAYLQAGLNFTFAPTPFLELNFKPFYYYGWNTIAVKKSSGSNAAMIENALATQSGIVLSSAGFIVEPVLRISPMILLKSKFTFYNFNKRIYEFESGLLVKDQPVWSPSLMLILPFTRNILWGLRSTLNYEFGLSKFNANIGPLFIFRSIIGRLSLSINPVYWIVNPEGKNNFSLNVALMGSF